MFLNLNKSIVRYSYSIFMPYALQFPNPPGGSFRFKNITVECGETAEPNYSRARPLLNLYLYTRLAIVSLFIYFSPPPLCNKLLLYTRQKVFLPSKVYYRRAPLYTNISSFVYLYITGRASESLWPTTSSDTSDTSFDS